MKIREIVREDATAGGTSAGAVAAVVAPLGSKKKKKKTEMIRRGRYANSVQENATAGGTSAGSVASSVRMPSSVIKKKKKVKEVDLSGWVRPGGKKMKPKKTSTPSNKPTSKSQTPKGKK